MHKSSAQSYHFARKISTLPLCTLPSSRCCRPHCHQTTVPQCRRPHPCHAHCRQTRCHRPHISHRAHCPIDCHRARCGDDESGEGESQKDDCVSSSRLGTGRGHANARLQRCGITTKLQPRPVIVHTVVSTLSIEDTVNEHTAVEHAAVKDAATSMLLSSTPFAACWACVCGVRCLRPRRC